MNSAEQNVENLFKNLQKEANKATEPRFADEGGGLLDPKALQDERSEPLGNTREELTTLAESGKIKYTVNYIKKASNVALDKIKADYERKHLDETNDYVANNILSSISELLKYFNLVKNPDELEQELKEKEM